MPLRLYGVLHPRFTEINFTCFFPPLAGKNTRIYDSPPCKTAKMDFHAPICAVLDSTAQKG